MPDKKKLEPKQERFCQEYIIDLHQANAALRAGYKEGPNIRKTAWDLMQQEKIQERIAELAAARDTRTQITADETIREIHRLATFDPADICHVESAKDIKTLPADVRRAIIGWKSTEYGLQLEFAKPKALELLGRHQGLFTDKIEHSGALKNMSDHELDAKISAHVATLRDSK